MFCQASLLGAARVSLCRVRPAESRAGRDPLSQPRLASRGLHGGLCLATREDTSRASSPPQDAAEPEVELKHQHVANLGKIRTDEQRQRAAETHRQRQAEKRAAVSAATAPRLNKFLRPKRLREIKRAKRAAAAAAAAAAGSSEAVAASRANALPLLAPAPSPKMNTQQLGQYQDDLKLYRELRAELELWSDAFVEERGRRPDRTDVNNTGIQWLIEKYTMYTTLKQKLLTRTPALRTSLAVQVRAEVPRPLAPGEMRGLPANWGKPRAQEEDE